MKKTTKKKLKKLVVTSIIKTREAAEKAGALSRHASKKIKKFVEENKDVKNKYHKATKKVLTHAKVVKKHASRVARKISATGKEIGDLVKEGIKEANKKR